MAFRILVVEDDPLITRLVTDNLVYEGFEVRSVGHGDLVLQAVREFAPALILLDLMLPGLDGFEICRAISDGPSRIPIIIISARSQSADKVRGLKLGADDYMTKPFTVDELLARIQAVMRRTISTPDRLVLGQIHIDFTNLQATKNNKPLPLTAREFDVLRFLAQHRNEVVTREAMLRSIWGYSQPPVTRPVDYFIARLRSKIEPDPHHPRYLQTVHNEGYRLTPSE